MIAPALAGQMNADEARRFVAGKVFAFTCFDGTRGAGRILDDVRRRRRRSSSPARARSRHVRLPGNTLQVRGQAVCASIKGIPFEPCFNLDKTRRAQFPRLGVGHGLRLLRFPSSGRRADADGARRRRGRARCMRRHDAARPTHRATEVTARVETPQVESAKLEPVETDARLPCAATPVVEVSARVAPFDRTDHVADLRRR